MSPLQHQISSSSYNTTTPAVRPFSSVHSGSKLVTDSAQRKLDRKRANARIRQQRCRARKRAKALEEEAKSFDSAKKIPDEAKKHLPPLLLNKPEESTSSATGKENKGHTVHGPPGVSRFWQPPPPHPHGYRKPMVKNIHKLAKVPPSIASAHALKPQQPQTAASYQATAPYYQHHHHHHAYNMSSWYGAWSQAAAAAYYGQPVHVTNPHPGYPPRANNAIVPSSGLPPKLPPTSPCQLISPMRNEVKSQSISDATTPYHEVDDIVKSPIRSLTDVVSTPEIKERRPVLASPDTGLLPPLWSTCTKPTPATYDARSPWTDPLPSPSLMTNTPAPHTDWSFASLGYHHDTPCLPTRTPVKTSVEMESWHSSDAAGGGPTTPTMV